MTALTLGASRVRYEVMTYFRQGDSVFFTFLFPVVMLTIFSVAFSEQNFGPDDAPLSAAAYYLPGMLAAGLLLSGLQNMAIDIAGEKSDGTLKRFAGTPLPVVSYFIGKIVNVFVTGVFQAALLIGDRGVPARRLSVPSPFSTAMSIDMFCRPLSSTPAASMPGR